MTHLKVSTTFHAEANKEALMPRKEGEKVDHSSTVVPHWTQGQVCPHCGNDKLDGYGTCGSCQYEAMDQESPRDSNPPIQPHLPDLQVQAGRLCPDCGVMAPEEDGEICGNCGLGLEVQTSEAKDAATSAKYFCQKCKGCPSHNPHLCPNPHPLH